MTKVDPKDLTRDDDGHVYWKNPADGEVYELPYIEATGAEVLDPTPEEPPIGYNPQPSLALQIREMVRSEKLRLEAEEAGLETFEEADDFEVGDDFDISSPYENDFDPPISEIRQEVERSRAATEHPQPKKAEEMKPKDEKQDDPQPPAPKPKTD